MTILKQLSEAEMRAFETECFAAWLNRIDARISYDARRVVSVADWRVCFDEGDSETDAIEWLQPFLPIGVV